jgi:hypothetical protein
MTGRKRSHSRWDIPALRAAVAAAASWPDAAARYNAATGQNRDGRAVVTRANQLKIGRPFATRYDFPWDYAEARRAVDAGRTWRERAALYNAATGQARTVKQFAHQCGDKRILPPRGVDTHAAIREANRRGRGLKGVAAAYRDLTGRTITPTYAHTLLTRAGLKLERYARPASKHPLILALESSVDRLAERNLEAAS